MQLFYEIFPVFLFFIAFKFFDIYVATVVGIVATFAQVVLTRFFQGKWDKKQLITFGVFVLFGGMTLYFHDPIFVKWKPSIVFGVFALVTLISQFVSKRPLMQRLMEPMLEGKAVIPFHVWRNLNIAWALYFLFLGVLNLYIAYNFSNDAWVNFKFYGISGALILLSVVQTFYLMRYMTDIESHDKSS